MKRERIPLLDKMKLDCRMCEHFSIENGCSWPRYAPNIDGRFCSAWEMNHLVVSWGKQQYISGSNDCHKAFMVGKEFNEELKSQINEV